jgi:hypothetical protein
MRDAMLMSLLVVCTLGCARVPAVISVPTPTPTPPVIAAPVVSRPAPTSVDVCRHVREVASKDRSASDGLDEVERDCIMALEQLRKQYDILTSCLLDTGTARDVAECEHSMRNETYLLSGPKPTGREVCIHVMDIMMRELGDASMAPSHEERTKFEDKCVKDLEKEQEKIGAEKFDAQVVCVMASTKIDELTQCDK